MRLHFRRSFYLLHLRDQRFIHFVLDIDSRVAVLRPVWLLCFVTRPRLAWAAGSRVEVYLRESGETFRWFDMHLLARNKIVLVGEEVDIHRLICIGWYFFRLGLFICYVTEGDVQGCFSKAAVDLWDLQAGGRFVVLILHNSMLI